MSANTNLLDRDLARRSVLAAAGGTAALIRDIVDEGTWVLGRIEQTVGATSTPRPAHVALVLLLRHVLSLADAVDELFRAGCFQPAMLPMRAILEARMQLLYILGERNPYSPNPIEPGDVDAVPRDPAGGALAGAALEAIQDQRGRAYWIAELRQSRDTAAGLDPAVIAPRLESLLGTRTVPAYLADPAVQAEAAAELGRWNALLAEADNAPIDAEFQRARGKKKHDPPSYALWGGPQSVWKLARSVGMAFQYDWFYSRASRTMHGTDVLGQLGPERPAGGRAVAPLRGAAGLDNVATAFVIQMYFVYRASILAVRPEEEPLTRAWLERWWRDPTRAAPTGR